MQSSYPNMRTIHAMTDQGHAGVTLESHTLPLIGIAAGVFVLWSDRILQYIAAAYSGIAVPIQLLFVVLYFALVLSLNHITNTYKRRRHGNEQSLVHGKVMHILAAMIILALVLVIYFTVNFNAETFAYWHMLLVFGLCMLVIGLFGTFWFVLNGAALIAVSIVVMLFFTPAAPLKFVTAALMVVGGIAVQQCVSYADTTLKQLFCLGGWMAIAVVSGMAVYIGYKQTGAIDDYQIVGVEQFQRSSPPEKSVIYLQKGTDISIHVRLESDAFKQPYKNKFSGRLAKDLHLDMNGYRAAGGFRIDSGKWLTLEDLPFKATYERTNTLLPDVGPQLKRHHVIGLRDKVLQ